MSSIINPNSPGLDRTLAAGQRVATRTSRFPFNAAAGTVIAQLIDPFGGGSTYQTLGTVPPQLALSGDSVMRGSAAAIAGAEYSISIVATSPDGIPQRAERLTFRAELPLGGTPIVTPPPPSSSTLGALTVSPSSATVGTAYSGTVSGRTSGSQLSLSGAGSAGLSIDNSTGAITGTPTADGPVNIVETLSGATNTPRSTSGALSVIAAATPTDMIVGTASRVNYSSYSVAQGNASDGRLAYLLGGEVTEFRPVFDNYFVNGSFVESPGGAFNVWMAFEWEGVTIPAKFAGVASSAAAPYAVAADQRQWGPDKITPADFFSGWAAMAGGNTFPHDARIYQRWMINAPNGAATIPIGAYYEYAGCNYYQGYAASGAIDQVSGTGSLTAQTGAATNSSRSGFGPTALIGRYSDGSLYSSVVTLGDSIMEGFGSNFAGPGGRGYGGQMLSDGYADTVAGSTAAKASSKASHWAAMTGWRWLLDYADTFHMQIGTNDFSNSGDSVTAQAMYDTCVAICSDAKSRMKGRKRVIRPYMTPRTNNGTQSTVAGQTTTAAWGLGGNVNTFHNMLDAQIASAPGVVFDTAPRLLSSRAASDPTTADFYKWNTVGDTITPMDSLGVHPTNTIHNLVSAELRPLILRDGRSSSIYYSAAVTTPVARMGAVPNAYVARLHSLIRMRQIFGVLAAMDGMYRGDAPTQQAAFVNLAQNAYDLTASGTITFVANSGPSGDGSTSYLETGFNPSTAAGKYQQNSAHLVAKRGAGTTNSTHVGAVVGTSGLSIVARPSSNLVSARVNQTTLSTSSEQNLDQNAHVGAARRAASGAGAVAIAKAGVMSVLTSGTDAIASEAMPNDTIKWGKVATGFNSARLQEMTFGASLTDGQFAAVWRSHSRFTEDFI